MLGDLRQVLALRLAAPLHYIDCIGAGDVFGTVKALGLSEGTLQVILMAEARGWL